MYSTLSVTNINSPNANRNRFTRDMPVLFRRDVLHLFAVRNNNNNVAIEEGEVSKAQELINKLFGATPENPLQVPIKAIQIEFTPQAKKYLTNITLLLIGANIGFHLIDKYLLPEQKKRRK